MFESKKRASISRKEKKKEREFDETHVQKKLPQRRIEGMARGGTKSPRVKGGPPSLETPNRVSLADRPRGNREKCNRAARLMFKKAQPPFPELPARLPVKHPRNERNFSPRQTLPTTLRDQPDPNCLPPLHHPLLISPTVHTFLRHVSQTYELCILIELYISFFFYYHISFLPRSFLYWSLPLRI